MNVFRRVCQWTAIAVMLALPMLSRGSALRDAYGAGASHVGQLADPWELFLYRAFSYLFGGFEDAAAVADLFQGGFWSLTLFGFTISDPLALAGHWAATLELHWPLVAGALLPLVAAALAGRVFCGWICPVGTLLELNARLRAWLERWAQLPRLPAAAMPPRLRWGVLVATLALTVALGVNVFAFVLPYAGLARDAHLAIFGQAVGFGVFFVVLLTLVELLAAPRLWCRSLCPTGLVLELAGKWRVFGVHRKPGGVCMNGCQACVAACPVAVNPRDEAALERCLVCDACVERCPAGVLEIGLAGRRPERRRERRPARRLGTALVLALALLPPADAAAHHMKGLPHYGYLENYPQTPTREQQVSAPPFAITLVAYALEGIKKSSADLPDDVMVYVSVTDTRTGKAYKGRLDLALRPVGGGPTVTRSFARPLEETVYRMRASLPASAYDVDIRIGGPGGVVAGTRLSFDGGIDPWLVAILGLVTAAGLGVGAMALRRRRVRRAGPGGHADKREATDAGP